VVTKFYTAALNNFGSLVWNKSNVTVLPPRLLRWLLDFENSPLPHPYYSQSKNFTVIRLTNIWQRVVNMQDV